MSSSKQGDNKRPLEGAGGSTEGDLTLKKAKSSNANVIPSNVFTSEELRTKLQKCWSTGDNFSDGNLTLCHQPFQHMECSGFVENGDVLKQLVDKMDQFNIQEKASDLFQFRQSDDLKSFDDPVVTEVLNYLKGVVLPWVKDVTGLPLNGDVDLFMSDYEKDDFLLCHDDELESRRIAFMVYLNEWKKEYGGSLDLFSATTSVHPDKVMTQIIPNFNKFAFFAVGPTSFHQVSEVTADGVKRLALSGWFYGDPIPRPKIEFKFDQEYAVKEHLNSITGQMAKFSTPCYLEEPTQSDINDQISEESQVLIPGFLQDKVYKDLCADLVEQDVGNQFAHIGPPNVANYSEMCVGPSPTQIAEKDQITTSSCTAKSLQSFFHSSEFLQFLEKITEMPFTSSELLTATSSIKKFGKGSYSLLRLGGAKQTGNSETDLDKNADVEGEEEEPNLVDVIYFVASNWDECWGGLRIYCTLDGDQLITIPPEGNCLAIVVRNTTVNHYHNFVNSDAGDNVYFAYTLTFALDGKMH